MTTGVLLLSLLSGLQSGSDIHLKGAGLKRFLVSRGASHVSRAVRWDVRDAVFSKSPLRRNRGYALFSFKRIGILVRLSDPGLQEVLRRGGRAVLRGRVRKVPKSRRKKGDPLYYLDVREVTRRKK